MSDDGANSGGAWEEAFVAMSVALGDDAGVAIAALGEPRGDGGEIVRALGDQSRAVRAKALALGVARIAQALDAMELE